MAPAYVLIAGKLQQLSWIGWQPDNCSVHSKQNGLVETSRGKDCDAMGINSCETKTNDISRSFWGRTGSIRRPKLIFGTSCKVRLTRASLNDHGNLLEENGRQFVLCCLSWQGTCFCFLSCATSQGKDRSTLRIQSKFRRSSHDPRGTDTDSFGTNALPCWGKLASRKVKVLSGLQKRHSRCRNS